MPGPRQPVDVLIAKGKKHLSSSEEAERRGREVKIAQPKTAKPPKWLAEELKKDFRSIGKRLIEAGLYTDLDADTLGRYLTSQRQYVMATVKAQEALTFCDEKGAEVWGRIQDRYFKQARNSANDLGLTVTSRCRLVLPEKATKEDENPFLRLIEGGRRA